MKTNYLSRIENRYVFNLSLIVWHSFILIAALSILISLAIVLWSIFPPSERIVVKEPYPEKITYPEPVKVSINELITEKKEKEIKESVEEQAVKSTEDKVIDENKEAFEQSIEELKLLVPPDKHSWQSAGYWTYPYGKRYWDVYKKAEYRRWVVTKKGIDELLFDFFVSVGANSYVQKSIVVNKIITVLKKTQESKRYQALGVVLSNTPRNTDHCVAILTNVAKTIDHFQHFDNIDHLQKLVAFGTQNPGDGANFIDYVSQIINRFEKDYRTDVLDRLIRSYYNIFNQNLTKLTEATDLYLNLLKSVETDKQAELLNKYFVKYLEKNSDRENNIMRIDQEYATQIADLDTKFFNEKTKAELELKAKKILKHSLRQKALLGFASGILIIVLIGTLLTFLSIQRSVSRIEENFKK